MVFLFVRLQSHNNTLELFVGEVARRPLQYGIAEVMRLINNHYGIGE